MPPLLNSSAGSNKLRNPNNLHLQTLVPADVPAFLDQLDESSPSTDTSLKPSETSFLILAATHLHQLPILLASGLIPYQLKEQLVSRSVWPQDLPQ